MCGIIGYIGKDHKAIKKTIECLENLEYRGYDSAGIAFVNNDHIEIIKEAGRIEKIKEKLNFNLESNMAIAHTRWATHGEATKVNAHPHQVGKVTIVHNGIIENYIELKNELQKEGYLFKTDTDTEVACAMIDHIYNKTNNILETLTIIKDKLKGSYALGIIFLDDLNTLYAIRKDSPLIIGIDSDAYFIASDIKAILEYTNKYIIVDDNEIVKLGNECYIYNNQTIIDKKIQTFNFEVKKQTKENFEHFMLKEINEQPIIIENLLNYYLKDNLKELVDLTNYERIDIVGCGSAYHTGLVAKSLFEEYAHTEINCYIASEYRYQTNFLKTNSLVIFISQSGETADTLACLRKINKQGIDTLAIVNAEGSSIAREAKEVIYIKAGNEVAVATTKAYTAQLTILALLALKVAYHKNLIKNLDEIKRNIFSIKEILITLINNIDYEKIAKNIYQKKDIFFIGRLVDYAIALEGSLKLKEISYINSSTYPAGELKHGTISLIEQSTPIISIITEPIIKDKTISNIKEVKARGAYSIVITNQDIDNSVVDELIKIPTTSPFLQPIITIVPLQLLAYQVARLNGCDIDKPRNLAKSVTVE